MRSVTRTRRCECITCTTGGVIVDRTCCNDGLRTGSWTNQVCQHAHWFHALCCSKCKLKLHNACNRTDLHDHVQQSAFCKVCMSAPHPFCRMQQHIHFVMLLETNAVKANCSCQGQRGAAAAVAAPRWHNQGLACRGGDRHTHVGVALPYYCHVKNASFEEVEGSCGEHAP